MGAVMGALFISALPLYFFREAFLKKRFSLRTLLILQLWIGALAALVIRYYRGPSCQLPVRELVVAAALWVPLMWSIIRDKSLPTSHGKGTGWRRFRRRNIPAGTLRER